MFLFETFNNFISHTIIKNCFTQNDNLTPLSSFSIYPDFVLSAASFFYSPPDELIRIIKL